MIVFCGHLGDVLRFSIVLITRLLVVNARLWIISPTTTNWPERTSEATNPCCCSQSMRIHGVFWIWMYSFSNNHGSGKWTPGRLKLVFQCPMFHFHDYGRKGICEFCGNDWTLIWRKRTPKTELVGADSGISWQGTSSATGVKRERQAMR